MAHSVEISGECQWAPKRRERRANAHATVARLNNPERSNRLLALLREEDRTRLYRYLEPVVLEYKRRLYDANQWVEFVYFI